MDAVRWKTVKTILEAALEIAPDARLAFLESACEGDEKLRHEVERLLEFEQPEIDLLEQEAVSSVLEHKSFAKTLIGKQIKNYKIISELGIGGMGAVFLAERADGEFVQRVALKLIKRGMDTDAVLRRFFNERQILASLEHPNIAHLVDGGTTDDGLPFFVMEYVEGVSIFEFAETKNLGLKERLTLFREVCTAVSFAHQNLVIHRDLKPSNILITNDGKPKLLDFGIAKLLKTDDENQTTTQNFVFTPEYASPEQMRGESLSTATDVYSLGVILYELLTGNRPIPTDSKNISEIIRAVCETQPKPPSSIVQKRDRLDFETDESQEPDTEKLNRITASHSGFPHPKSLRGDLDNIILKSLRKEPERRYSSVEKFSEDIRRHLSGLPVAATKSTLGYNVSKFVQRNRIVVGAAALIFLTIIGGLAATLYQANKAQRRFNDVRQLANSFLFEFHDAIEDLPGATPARELVVKRALEYLDNLASESASNPTLQRELAAAYSKIGKIQGNSYYSNLGDTDGAVKSYARSLEIRQRLANADPANNEIQNELAESHEGVGDMQYTLNELKDGLQSYESAVTLREATVSAQPENREYRYALANVLAKRGDISGMEGFPNLGDTPGALESYKRVQSLFAELIKAEPENDKYQIGYGTTLQFLGMLQTTTGDSKSAVVNGQKSVQIFETLITSDPNNQKFETHLMMGLVFLRFPLLEEGRTAEAVANARRVIQAMEKVVAQDPKNVQTRRSLSVGYNSLGKCLLAFGDTSGAIESHRQSLKIINELAANDTASSESKKDQSVTSQYLAEAQLAAGKYDDALQNLRVAVSQLELELAADNPDVQTKDDLALCLVSIGKILATKGDLPNAANAFRRALPLADEVMQKTPFNVRFKSRHASSFFEAGKVFGKLAENENSAVQGKTVGESCSSYKRSFEIWNEMRQSGTLSLINAKRPDEAANEIRKCNG